MKRLIVTADDFGLAVPVNEAVVEAHRRGILTTASLMVGADSAADAIEKARALPSLRVGLHLVLVEGRPVLPPEKVPYLVDVNGEFSTHLTQSGFRFFFRQGVREQLEAEIRAQFEAFRQSGLALDHVNAHNHMHFHPTVLRLLLKVGSEYGLRAVRLPCEPPLRSWKAARGARGSRLASYVFLLPLICLMKRSLRKHKIEFNDFIFGMQDSGAMTQDRVLAFLRHLPEGITELYFHPSMRRCPEIDRTMPDYQHEEEFRSLTDPAVLQAVHTSGAERIAFSDLPALRSRFSS